MMTELHKAKLKEARAKARENKKGLDQKVNDLSQKFDQLVEIVGSFVENQNKKILVTEAQQEVKAVSVSEMPIVTDLRYAIPSSWRSKIDSILGTNFKAEIQDSSGGNYLLIITIPQEFDRRVGDEKQLMKADTTSGLIRRATDVSDVEHWCNLVKASIQKKYPEFQK